MNTEQIREALSRMGVAYTPENAAVIAYWAKEFGAGYWDGLRAGDFSQLKSVTPGISAPSPTPSPTPASIPTTRMAGGDTTMPATSALEELIRRGVAVGLSEGVIRSLYNSNPAAAENLVTRSEGSKLGIGAGSDAVQILQDRYKATFTPFLRQIIDDAIAQGATLEELAQTLESKYGYPPASPTAGFDQLQSNPDVAALPQPPADVDTQEELFNYWTEQGYRVEADANGNTVVIDPYTGSQIAVYDPNGAIVSAGGSSVNGGGGGGGGGGRYLLPEEKLALDLQNERDRRILAGELGWQEVQPGFWQDPITGATYDKNDLELARQRIAEDARQFDTSFEEQVRQFNQNFNENRRQFDVSLGENRRQFDVTESRLRDRLNLDAELGRRERSLAENNAVVDILRNPADFLARAFLQRGVQSPLQTVTQADLVTSLRNAISSASGGNVTPTGEVLGAPGGSRLQEPQAAPTTPQTALIDAASAGPQTSPLASTINKSEGVAYQPTQNNGEVLFSGDNGNTWVMRNGQWEQVTTPDTVAQPPAPTVPAYAAPPVAPTPVAPQPAQVNSPLLNINSQQDIIDTARQYSPPAVNALINGTTEQMQPLNLGFATPTPRQTSRLTGAETEALNTRLAAEFNTDLNDLAAQQQQLFGATRSRRRGRLLV